MQQFINDEEYSKKLHDTELNIMDAIAYACEKLGLRYVIYAGSLLGAIRHKGFIPWDDDIDIIMPREDYEIFIAEAHKYLDSKFVIQHYINEKNTNVLWTKVRNKNTLFLENENKNLDICHGIFVDIFPFDKIKKGKFHSKVEYFRRIKFTMICGCYSQQYIDSIISPAKRIVAKMIKKCICDRKPIYEMISREDERRKKLNKKGDDCYPIHFFENKGTLTYDQLFDAIDLAFEDRFFKGTKHFELGLKKLYGENYMQLPPEEKRITHKPLCVEFEK